MFAIIIAYKIFFPVTRSFRLSTADFAWKPWDICRLTLFWVFFNLYIFVPRHSLNPLTHSLCLFRVLGLVYNYSHFLNHVSQACAFFRKTPNQLEQLSAPHFGDFQFWNTPESYRENCAKVCCRSGARQGCAKR